MERSISVAQGQLFRFTADVLLACGLSEPEANQTAETLISASLRGVDSHGIAMLPTYVSCIQAGGMLPGAEAVIEYDRGSILGLDGRHGIGPVIAEQATRLCLERAREHGVAVVTLRNSNHIGMLAYYARQFTRENQIGIVMTNNGANLVPWGARSRFLGNNALAVAVPVPGQPPLVYDIATGAAAASRVRLAKERGEELPPGVIVDAAGRPATDPGEFVRGGGIMPFGQHKGTGLAILIDIFAGLLSGGYASPEVRRMVDDPGSPSLAGQFFCSFQIGLFGRSEFPERLAAFLDLLRGLQPAEGTERVLAPGDKEEFTEAERRSHGILLQEAEIRLLTQMARNVGVDIAAYL